MTAPGRWAKVSALFHDAMERPEAERAAYARAHAGDPEIAHEVESLLLAEPHAEGFLSTPLERIAPVDAAAQLVPGSRLGPFEIVSLLGAGGMGEVYRARDTRLDRTVAIKVLAREVAAQRPNRERFEREARAVSRLAHPHVCTLHDVGVEMIAGIETQFLVMEFVDGETLAARLRRGPLPVGQALQTGIEILEALSAAHALGIVHRDLKPGNVMLTKSGVKLLDFGLARLLPTRGGEYSTERVSADPLTNEGVLIGTVPYMSPEQLRGEPTEASSDIFAFGTVLYETITGVRAFAANSPAELAAAILEHDPPPVTTRQPLAPPALDRVIATCLAKHPDDRWQRARDVLRELQWMRDDGGRRSPPETASSRRRLPWPAIAVVAAGVVAAMFAALLLRPDTPPPSPAPRVSFTIEPPKGTTFPRASAEIAISPDGTRIVFVALSADGTPRLWLRRFEATDSLVIAGTDGARYPFWSPDGRSIAFFTLTNKLVRIDEKGGARQELAATNGAQGGSWAGDQILFSAEGVLKRVAAAGGSVTQVTTLDLSRKERRHAWPAFLPDGRRFLYASLPADGGEPAIYQGSLGAATTERVLAGSMSFVVAGRRLLSLNNRTLVAHTLDSDRARVTGEPVEVATGVGVDVRSARGAIAVSDSSVLAYRIVGDHSRLQWFDRQGRPQATFHERADYQHPWLSSDGTRLAVEKTDPSTGRHTVWIIDVARDVTSRLLVEPAGAHVPVWSPDGARIVFNSSRTGSQADMFAMRADGTGESTVILNSADDLLLQPSDWSRDLRYLLYTEFNGRGDLWVLPMAPPGPAQPFLKTNANELQGRFSPDGRWIAYTSDESGVPEIYVRRFPGGEGKWRVSIDGGAQAQWRGDGKELFYLAADGKLMASTVTSDTAPLTTSPPRALFDTGIRGLFVERRNHYVVTGDGQRFLFNLTDEDDVAAPITVVLNWDSNPQ